MTYLLDSSVIIDALNGRHERPRHLAQLSEQGILLACCPINVTEVHMGMRPAEAAKTKHFLKTLEFYAVTWEAAELAGELYRYWRQKGQTLALPDLTIAAVAITNKLVLVTDNRKHFPMTELKLHALSAPRD